MEAMGPESALLAALPARVRPDREFAALEYTRENPLYVAAASAACRAGVPEGDRSHRLDGLWMGLARTRRRLRDRPASESTDVPVAGLPAAGRAPP